MRITEVKVRCPVCGWAGTIGDAEPDVDGEGSPGCPECLCNVSITETRLEAGCGSHSCRVARPKGMGVNGPCRCPKEG